MRKLVTRVLTLLCAVCMLLPLTHAMAANTSDTSWGWNIGSLSGPRYTVPREKTNATPIYFYVEYINLNNARDGYLRLEVVHESGRTLRNGSYHARNATKPGKYCLSSNAFEDYGYGVKVKVRGDRYKTSGIDASGFWSPDSKSCN